MKWHPQPKGNCARPDCTRDAMQGGYCMNHYHLFRRNGVPYRQDEISEHTLGNSYVRDMDDLLEENPPVIVWRLDPVRKVQVAVSVYDPHAERGAVGWDETLVASRLSDEQKRKKTEAQRLRRQRRRDAA